MRCARRVISIAARRVKVSNRMRSGCVPPRMRCATRWASVLVLPVPAPAMTSSGCGPACAASRCRGLRRSKAAAVLTAATIGQCCINFQYLGLQSVWKCFYPPRIVLDSRRQGSGDRLSGYRGELRTELGVGRAVHRLLEGSHAEPRIDDPANRRAAPDGSRGGSGVAGLLAGEQRLLVRLEGAL